MEKHASIICYFFIQNAKAMCTSELKVGFFAKLIETVSSFGVNPV